MKIVLADDVVAVGLEHLAHDRAKLGVVVDDEDRAGHSVIVDTHAGHLNTAGRTPAAENRTTPAEC